MRRERRSDSVGAPIGTAPRLSAVWRSLLGVSPVGTDSGTAAMTEALQATIAAAPWLIGARIVAAAITLWTVAPIAPRLMFMTLVAMSAVMIAVDLAFTAFVRLRAMRRAGPELLHAVVAVYALLVGGASGLTFRIFELPLGHDAATVLVAARIGFAIATAITFSTLPVAALACWAGLLLPALALYASPPLALSAACLTVFPVAMVLTDMRRRRHFVRRRAASSRAAHQASLLLTEFEASGRGWFWETDASGRLTYISAELAEALGRRPTDLLGSPFTELVLNGDDDDVNSPRGERTLGFHLSARIAFSDVAVRAAETGDVRWWSLSGRPAFDERRHFIGFRGSGSDLTERRRSEAEISRLARYDPLTGLPNRVVMRQTLESAVRDGTARGDNCALFLIDLDRFKTVNDTLGHPVGDALLREVAERLQQLLGDTGRVGRLGGDEFNIVLPGIGDRGRLSAIARAVIERISMPYMIDGAHVSIGASLGVAVSPDDGATADALVRNADLALYAAKADGKGVHRFYEAEMHANAKDRRLLEIDLRKVLGAGGLHLLYQPIVDAATEQVVGFEALARWNHPTRGPVSPASFIPIAEEIGLIPQIGEWVIRSACAEAARWPGHTRVAVNISPIHFANPQLPATIVSALAASNLAPDRLEIEITEGVFLNDDDATDGMFAKLKAIGVRFALDDFGTGYSSLGYLRKAPFDKIKIDQSFVRGAAIPGNRNAEIIKAIVTLATSLEMETTAEGAETREELEMIRSLGCSHIQGFIFGQPVSADEARLRAQREGLPVPEPLATRPPRAAVLRSAVLLGDGRSQPVRVRNLSSGGAMIEIERGFAVGTRLELELADGQRYRGDVRWAERGRLGMAFVDAFDISQVPAVRPVLARTG